MTLPAVVVGVPAAVLAISTVAPWLVAVALLAAAGVLVLPLFSSRHLRPTRRPTDAERRELRSLRETAGLDVDRAYVVESDRGGDEPPLDVAVRGPPGWRVLFVGEGVLAAADESVATALLAAEAGRVATNYAAVRAVAVGVVIALLAAVYAVPLPFDLGLLGMGAFALVAFAVGRRRQYAADARAADRVGAAALADAFERVAARRGVEPATGSWRTLFEVQPPLGDRIERLRERAG